MKRSHEPGGIGRSQPSWADTRLNEIITDDLVVHVAWISGREWKNPKARRLRVAFVNQYKKWEWIRVDRSRIRST
jgi:hypothetical protein